MSPWRPRCRLSLALSPHSYGRWWEARTYWGSAYLSTRSILRLVSSSRLPLVFWVSGFCCLPPPRLAASAAVSGCRPTMPPPLPPPARLPARQPQCISFVARDSPELLPALHRWTAALLPAMAGYLRGQEHYYRSHLKDVLSGAELEWLCSRGSPAIAVLQVLSVGGRPWLLCG